MDAGRPSATALLVALSVALRCHDPAVQEDLPATTRQLAHQALADAGPVWALLGALARSGVGRALLRCVERAVLPGLSLHHVQRKRWIASRLRLLAGGLTDCQVLGAGHDGLALELATRFPRLRVAEHDHPDTQARKRRLPALAHAPSNLDWRGGDLAGPPEIDACRGPSLVLAEGVLMYLPRARAWRLLDALARRASPPQLLVTMLAPVRPSTGGATTGARRRAFTDWWLRRVREPFRWRADPDVVVRLAARRGYEPVAAWRGPCFGEYALLLAPRAPQIAANASRAAATVSAMSCSECAADTKPASNADGAR